MNDDDTVTEEQLAAADHDARAALHTHLESFLGELRDETRTVALMYIVEVGAQMLALAREKDRGRFAKRAALHTAGMALYGARSWRRRTGFVAFFVPVGVIAACESIWRIVSGLLS